MDLPPELTIEDENSFAWQVFHHRHPEMFRRLFDAHPYSPGQRRALDTLLAETLDGVIPGVPDGWDDSRVGMPWARMPFLWAESYFYRRLLDAAGYFETGVDPFAPFKTAELRDPGLESAFDLPETFDAALMAALLGNQADLSFRMVASGGGETHDQLVADDSDRLRRLLTERAPGKVIVVLDNAGRELLSDLVFTDHLLAADLAGEVVLHTKPHPYFVSDATHTDVGDCLRRLREFPGTAGDRLHEAAATGRLKIRTHAFHCAPSSFHDMPADLADEFGNAVTIFKGDLNYRRLVGDRAWDPTTSFQDAVSYLPGPAAALRILKSEVVVGLTADRVRELDERDPRWRVGGNHALIQVSVP
ncbi:MAG: damage-control phosphatase ARMT1 family protein [Kibdelosporangium sp.]